MLFLNDGCFYNTDRIIYINPTTGYVRFSTQYYTKIEDKKLINKIIECMGVIELEGEKSEKVQKRSTVKKTS